jgi:hypothetical protein
LQKKNNCQKNNYEGEFQDNPMLKEKNKKDKKSLEPIRVSMANS